MNSMTEAIVRSASATDAEVIAGIYNHYVRNTVITFEEEPVEAPAMAARIAEVQTLLLPWLVVEAETKVAGYAYATRWKERSAYRYSVETTIYLDQCYEGLGIGTTLYRRLLATLRTLGMHTAIGGIALPNDVSIALHRKLGFKHTATFHQVGFKHGRWVDVGYWQLML